MCIRDSSRAARVEIEEEVRRVTRIETAIAPRFQEHFVAANAIPHATDAYPGLVGQVTLPEVSYNMAGDDRPRRRRR